MKITRRQQRTLIHTAAMLALTGAFAVLFYLAQPFSSINSRLTDQLFLDTTPSPNIVIVAIDDATLGEYGRLAEWPRSRHADVIRSLNAAGAQVIVFDVLFSEPAPDDGILASAIRDAGNVVLAAAGADLIDIRDGRWVYASLLVPEDGLGNGAVIGHANVAPDADGIVRRLPAYIGGTGQAPGVPSLSLAATYRLLGQSPPGTPPFKDGYLQVMKKQVPVNGSGDMRINFSGSVQTYKTISYSDLLEGNFDPAAIARKIVLIGVTASGGQDSWVTPVSGEKMSGTEIHANALDTILRERFLTDESRGHNLLMCLLLAGITSLALPVLKVRWGSLLVVLLLVGFAAWSFYQFDAGLAVGILYPLAILPVAFAGNLAFGLALESRDRRRIENTFGRYVSHQVAREIQRLDDRKVLCLGGEQCEATVWFCDARGFTSLSETLGPEKMINVVNEYFCAIIPCVLENQGMINKFAGDNIMAVWGVPSRQAEHAMLATRAAFQARQAIAALHESRPELPRVLFGFGVNTGPVVAGNVGSTGRTEYTVMGDTVNVASRLCGAAPGGKIWVSDAVYARIKDSFEVSELEPQSLKGKQKPVSVYEIVTMK